MKKLQYAWLQAAWSYISLGSFYDLLFPLVRLFIFLVQPGVLLRALAARPVVSEVRGPLALVLAVVGRLAGGGLVASAKEKQQAQQFKRNCRK